MKLWLKYIFGVVCGIILSVLLPNNDLTFALYKTISQISINIGRMWLMPLLFFSLAIAIFTLKSRRVLYKILLAVLALSAIMSFIITFVAFIACLVYKMPTLLVLDLSAQTTSSLNLKELILSIFPSSAFTSLTNGDFVLPSCMFAGLLGYGMAKVSSNVRGLVTIFDNMSQVCYAVTERITDLLCVCLIGITAFSVARLFAIKDSNVYRIIAFFSVLSLFIIFVLLPLILILLLKEKRPYKVIFSCFCSMILALVSGDMNLCLQVQIRQCKQAFNIKRQSNAITMPLLCTFCRAGSAAVTLVSFVIITNSYSRLGIGIADLFLASLLSFLLSFAFCNFSIGGEFMAISFMAKLFEHTQESSSLLLLPYSFILSAFSCLINVMCANICAYIIAKKTGNIARDSISAL